MTYRLCFALGVFFLSLGSAARGQSPVNPAGAWPSADSGPGAAPDLRLKQLPVGKILFLGNSITVHGPVPAIGLTGNWGMAATTADKDYVHRVAAHIAQAAGGQPKWMSRNIADFERGHADYDIAAGMKDELALKPDLVIVAIGENVPNLETDQAQAAYRAAYARLLATLTENSNPTIVVRSCFWSNPVKDELMREAATAAGAIFVDVGALGRDPANAARSERQIVHPGIAGHPGDRGMQAIADALIAAIEARADAKR